MSEALFRIPRPLRPLAVGIEAWRRGRRKFGSRFRHHVEFLLSSSAAERDSAAEAALGEYLERLRHESRHYQVPASLDLRAIPVIDKEVVVANQGRLALDPAFITAKSSGTSGRAILMPYTRDAYQREYAFWWYHAAHHGVRRGARVAMISGHHVVEIDRDEPPFWVLSPYDNHLYFSSYHLAPRNLPHYLDRLERFRPELIHGYPSSVYLLARQLLETGRRLSFQPRMIRTASETLLSFQAETIREAFACVPSNWYGNTEFAGHAEQCRVGRLHLQPWHSHVRVLRADGADAAPGEEGNIVATNFANTALPLVNYDTRDVARVSVEADCACGMGGTLLEEIVGRVEDYVVTRDGRLVGRLDHLFKSAAHVRCAQLQQSEPGRLVIRIERDEGYDAAEEREIAAEARRRLGSDVELEFDYVSEIPRLASGKTRFVVQRIPSAALERR